MNIFHASPADAGCFYKDIPLFCYLLCQVVDRLNENIFCNRRVITSILIKRCIRQNYLFYT